MGLTRRRRIIVHVRGLKKEGDDNDDVATYSGVTAVVSNSGVGGRDGEPWLDVSFCVLTRGRSLPGIRCMPDAGVSYIPAEFGAVGARARAGTAQLGAHRLRLPEARAPWPL